MSLKDKSEKGVIIWSQLKDGQKDFIKGTDNAKVRAVCKLLAEDWVRWSDVEKARKQLKKVVCPLVYDKNGEPLCICDKINMVFEGIK